MLAIRLEPDQPSDRKAASRYIAFNQHRFYVGRPLSDRTETIDPVLDSYDVEAPLLEDLEAFGQDQPERIRSRAYDITLNGVEIGGGSIRIHRSDIQDQVFKLLNLDDDEIESKFGFLMKALSYGAPPHGGIALGFDRIMMFLLKTESIRDVIAFPKTQRASCLMTEAPSKVSRDQLEELQIRIRASVGNQS